MMKIKKFSAPSIPEALNLARRELGEDALILGTARRPAAGGRRGPVEVVAGTEGGAPGTGNSLKERPASGREEIETMRKTDRDLVNELKVIEARLKDVLRKLPASGTVKAASQPLYEDLLRAGFDPEFVRNRRIEDGAGTEELVRSLIREVPIQAPTERISVFVGPSGSGKTTSLLKVTAKCLAEDVKPLVIYLGPDSRDVGWLKSECRRLGARFKRIDDLRKLDRILARSKGRVLVDTPSISDLGDRELRHLIGKSGTDEGVRIRLVVDSTMDPTNLCGIASCIPETGRLGLVLTKLDEAVRIGGAVSVALSTRIPLVYVTGGRRATDGIFVPDADLLVEKILDGPAVRHV
jgi:flagellar biosynthesis protein FlhF